MDAVEGTIKSIVFYKKETGFHILDIDLGKGKKTKAKGEFPSVTLSSGLKVRLRGEFTTHSKYGRQFNAISCEIIPVLGKAGIVSYLSANVPSIGLVTANKLYDVFGDELPDILDKNPDKIRGVPFLKKSQIESILQEWTNSSEKRTAAIFLGDVGLNSFQIRSVFLKFGTDTNKIIKADPYRLSECASIGFQTSDQAARKLGINVDDARRVRAMILFAVDELGSGEGHVYVTSEQIKDMVRKLFRRNGLESFSHGDYLSDSDYYSNLMELEKSGHLVMEDNCIYSSTSYRNEKEASFFLAKNLDRPPRDLGDFDACLAEYEELKNIEFSDDQKRAFRLLKDSRVCAISGYPGTGKTLLMGLFVHLFKKNNIKFTLMSPTGIAAKRLSQLTREPAYTIHRALGCSRDGVWEFDRYNKYEVDAVILDEMSMVDNSVFYHLISALPDSTILVFVGDSAQLPSVGSGLVLRSLLSCPDVPHISLTKIYRQEGESGIVRAAHQILKGGPVDTKFDPKSDFLFMRFKQDDVIGELKKVTAALKDKESNFQVIAPLYDGDLGVDNLNRKIRGVLNTDFINDNAAKLKHGNADMFEGDRVMIVKNDYDRMVFNGDVGKIQRIQIKKGIVEVKVFNWFDQESTPPKYIDKIFSFSIEEAHTMLRVSYACTVHRSQGQEYDYILLPMTKEYGPMLYRNLIYTAITRARKKVFVLGDARAFETSVRNVRELNRNTNLSSFITESLQTVRTEKVVDS